MSRAGWATAACAAGLVCLQTALAEPPASAVRLRAADAERLADLDASAGRGLRAALAAGSPSDLAVVAEAMAGEPLPPNEAMAAIEGRWSCRVAKMGGNLPLVVYDAFACEVDGRGFRKVSGSQRSTGTLEVDGDRLLYVGVGHVADDPAPPGYDALPDGPGLAEGPQRVPVVGVVEMVAADRGRILQPWPQLESEFDLLILSR